MAEGSSAGNQIHITSLHVREGENGLLADVDDIDALVAAVERVHDARDLRVRLREEGRATAEAYGEERLDPLWAQLLEGFVDGAR